MIKKGLTEFRVGLFVAAGLLLAMAFIFMIGGEHRLFEQHHTLYANFEGIAGLRIGAPVQLAGLKVGFVDKIVLPEEISMRKITVVMRVQKQFRERIRADSVATIETQGLLGDKYIYVSMGSDAQGQIPDRGIVPSRETTSIFALAEKAGEIMDDIAKASEAVNEMLSSVRGTKGEGDLKASIASIRKTLEQIERGKGVVHALIYDPKGEMLISDLAEAIGAMRGAAAGADGGGRAGRAGLVPNLREASEDLKAILKAMRRGEGTLGRLMSDPALYEDLRALVGRANRSALLKAVVRSTIRENERDPQ